MRMSLLFVGLAAATLALGASAGACPDSKGAAEGPATSSAATPAGPTTPVAASWGATPTPGALPAPRPGHHEDAEPRPSGPETGEEGRQGG